MGIRAHVKNLRARKAAEEHQRKLEQINLDAKRDQEIKDAIEHKVSEEYQRKLEQIEIDAKRSQELQVIQAKIAQEEYLRKIEEIKESTRHEIECINAKAQQELEIKDAEAKASTKKLKDIINIYERERAELEEMTTDELLRELILHKHYIEDSISSLKGIINSLEVQMKQFSSEVEDIRSIKESLTEIKCKLGNLDYNKRFDHIDDATTTITDKLVEFDWQISSIESNIESINSQIDHIDSNISMIEMNTQTY